MLAFSGSESNPLHQSWYPDWETNIVAHVGPRPRQYEFAFEAADNVKEKWRNGFFDRSCGDGHPALVLTGLSKGGAEAQFSAVGLEFGAVAFNSDWVTLTSYKDIPLPGNQEQHQDQTIDASPRPTQDYGSTTKAVLYAT